MEFVLWGILAALIILIFLVLIIFLHFQTSIQQALNDTRKEVSNSKDIISDHGITTIKTIDGVFEVLLCDDVFFEEPGEDPDGAPGLQVQDLGHPAHRILIQIGST
jgi:hypothetical protein